MNDATLRRPTDRTCELCGRTEQWDTDSDAWRVVREDGDPQVGELYCIHEWDINGTFVPIENPDNGAQA
jgi:hypothetical protein